MWLLAHWSLHLKDASDRLACRALLGSYLGLLLRPVQLGTAVFICLTEPAPVGLACCGQGSESTVGLYIQDQCKVDVSPLLLSGVPAALLFKRLLNASRTRGSLVTLSDLILILVGGGSSIAFVTAQLLGQLALLIEKAFAAQNFNRDVLKSSLLESGRIDDDLKEEVVMGAVRKKLVRKPADLTRVIARLSNGWVVNPARWTNEACIRKACVSCFHVCDRSRFEA
jgi:hypothetical protein